MKIIVLETRRTYAMSSRPAGSPDFNGTLSGRVSSVAVPDSDADTPFDGCPVVTAEEVIFTFSLLEIGTFSGMMSPLVSGWEAASGEWAVSRGIGGGGTLTTYEDPKTWFTGQQSRPDGLKVRQGLGDCHLRMM